MHGQKQQQQQQLGVMLPQFTLYHYQVTAIALIARVRSCKRFW